MAMPVLFGCSIAMASKATQCVGELCGMCTACGFRRSHALQNVQVVCRTTRGCAAAHTQRPRHRAWGVFHIKLRDAVAMVLCGRAGERGGRGAGDELGGGYISEGAQAQG